MDGPHRLQPGRAHRGGMIIGTGFDLVSTERIRHSLERFGERFLLKILTDAEYEAMPAHAGARVEYAAARFAAKEAAVKALGTGFSGGTGLHDVEVVRTEGRPLLRLHGAAARTAAELGVAACHLSLSHERGMAGAVVILEK